MSSEGTTPLAAAVNPTATAASPGPADDLAGKAQKTGEDFESFFLSQVFENMFAGVDADPIFGGGQGENVYRSLLLQEYSKVAARSGGIGVADAVQREILRAQETK